MKFSITLANIIALVAAAPVEVRDPHVGNGVGPGLNQGPSRGPQGFPWTWRPQDGADRPGLNKFLEDDDGVDVGRPTSGGPQDDAPGLNEGLYPNDMLLGRRKTAVVSSRATV